MTFATTFDLSHYRRVAVLGIGNELNGDDAAGVLVARALKACIEQGGARSAAAVLSLEAGAAPESFTGVLRRFQPDLVIFADAAHLDQAAGSVAWIAWQNTVGLSASTHTLPPSVLAEYLIHELGCDIVLIGIQPKSIEFDAPVSAEVQIAVDQIVANLLLQWKN